MGSLKIEDFLWLFRSEEHWRVPIESFIEVFCLIFTPGEDKIDEETAGERKKIFEDYKKLINELLAETLMKRSKGVTFNKVLAGLGEYIHDD
jgi:hypothetical protein